MAAEVAAGEGCRVTVFERMPSVGRKLLMAGRGGLNLTHSEPVERFLGRYGGAAGVMEAVRAFPPEALRAWCAGLGEETFVGSSGRVFPRSWKASPLLRAWLRRLGAAGVAVRTGHRWTGWEGADLVFETAAGVVRVAADAAVLALGGASWPRLGSDGAWGPVLAGSGVEVAPLRAANAGFVVPWSGPMRRFAGEPLKRIAATFEGVTVRGEAMVTRDGLEGGVVYALGAAVREVVAARGSAEVVVDLRPDLDVAAVSARLGGAGVSMANALRRAGLAPVAGGLVREFADGRALAERVKGVRVRVAGMQGLGRAISTAGGVVAGALEGGMLRGRPGVFVAGEMLDWEAPTGGYLLQGCFASGRVAGLGAAGWALASGPQLGPLPRGKGGVLGGCADPASASTAGSIAAARGSAGNVSSCLAAHHDEEGGAGGVGVAARDGDVGA